LLHCCYRVVIDGEGDMLTVSYCSAQPVVKCCRQRCSLTSWLAGLHLFVLCVHCSTPDLAADVSPGGPLHVCCSVRCVSFWVV
jgi:hypothetical protein